MVSGLALGIDGEAQQCGEEGNYGGCWEAD